MTQLKTLKDILASLDIDESVINSCPDIDLYSAEEIAEITDSYETKLSESEINSAVNIALVKSGAKNNLTVKALLDMDNIHIKNGKINGLEEQISKIKAENSYLFKADDSVTGGNHVSFTSDDLDSMSDEQYYSIKYGKEN